jgi:RNA polymerase sigma factor (sigma-70 family)
MATETSADDDETLLMRVAVERDQGACALLIERHAPKVTGYLTERFFKSLKQDGIDDAINITYMRVWKYAESFFRKKRTFESWIIAIAHRVALTLLREKKERACVSLDDNPDLDPADPCDEDEPPDGTYKDWEVRALDDFIEKELTGLQQAVARKQLAAGGRADYDQIADEYGVTKNTAYVTWNTVKKKFLKRLEEIRKQQTRPKGKT